MEVLKRHDVSNMAKGADLYLSFAHFNFWQFLWLSVAAETPPSICKSRFFRVCSRDNFSPCHHGNTAKINYLCRVWFFPSNILVAKYRIKGIIIFKYLGILFYIKRFHAFYLKRLVLTFFLWFTEWLINEYYSGYFGSDNVEAFKKTFYIVILYREARRLKCLPS